VLEFFWSAISASHGGLIATFLRLCILLSRDIAAQAWRVRRDSSGESLE
jgi:hypothetical protein